LSEYPRIRARGSSREIGRQYGEQASRRVRRSIGAYRQVFADLAGLQWPQVTDNAMRFVRVIENFNSRYVEEMRGIAEGAQVPFEDILAINVRTEVMFAARARMARQSNRLLGECSSFAVLPAKAGAHTLIGQNWDWLLHTFDTVVVLEVEQETGPNFVTVVEAGLLAKTGMNSSGLGVATNALVTDDDRGAEGVPYHVLLRAFQDCHNLSDALAVLQSATRASSANYLLAHSDGVVVDVEAAPGDFAELFLTFPAGQVMVHTNHFTSPRFNGRDVSIWAMPDSPIRQDRMQRAVEAPGFVPAIDSFRSLLSDHANYPSGICCHPDERMVPYDQGATVASVLMDLNAKKLWLADGPPCTTPYRELDYAELLGKPSPIRRTERIE
jgi:isopenicillin-N N-acyltransferase-like protein